MDSAGVITSWSRGGERIKGYRHEERLSQHFSAFYPPEQVEDGYPTRLLEAALASGSVEDSGWRVRKDGSRFWANVVITAVFDDEGTHQGFVKVTRDATDEHERDGDGGG